MKLIRYGITLNRLTQNDLELLRKWRNSEKIRQNMIFRDEITPDMQLNWFESINNYNNFFYIIEFKSEKIGLIDNKGTDWQAGSTHSGLFIYEEKYINSQIPVAASLILMQIGYHILNIQVTKIKVLTSNKLAISYNKQLGFVESKNEQINNFVEMVQTRESFNSKTLVLHKALLKLNPETNPNLILHLEPPDYEIGVAQGVEKEIQKMNPFIIVKDFKNMDTRILEFNV